MKVFLSGVASAPGRWVFGGLLCALLFVGCASVGRGDTRRALLQEWSSGLIVPLYEEASLRGVELARTVQSLCDSPSEEALRAAQDQWDASRVPLKQAEVFAFGPYSRVQYNSIGPKIDSWPAKVDRVEDRLVSDSPVTPEAIAQAGVWLKGSPVLEYFLFSEEALTQLGDARRCEYLVSVAEDYADRTAALAQAWSPSGGNFAAELSEAGRTGTAFLTLRDAFGEIVNRMGFTLENIRSLKLGAALGEENGGTAQPDLVESFYSGRSLQDIADNLSGLEWLYFGDEARGFRGLRVYEAEQGADFSQDFRTHLDSIEQALQALSLPLSEAVEQQPEQVAELSARVQLLERLIQADLIGALGLTVTFNDNDGD